MTSYDYTNTIVEALTARYDELVADLRDNRCEYVKGDWRGDIHRKRQARRIRAVRGALRQMRRQVAA